MLDGPLCGDDDFMGSMEALQDIPTSIDEDALSSLDVPDYQSSHNGSEGSSILGKTNSNVLSPLQVALRPIEHVQIFSKFIIFYWDVM